MLASRQLSTTPLTTSSILIGQLQSKQVESYQKGVKNSSQTNQITLSKWQRLGFCTLR